MQSRTVRFELVPDNIAIFKATSLECLGKALLCLRYYLLFLEMASFNLRNLHRAYT